MDTQTDFCIVDTVFFNANKPLVFDDQFKGIPNCTLVVSLIGHNNVEYEFTPTKEFNANFTPVKLLAALNFM